MADVEESMDPSPYIAPERRAAPGVILVEPLAMNGTYCLDLRPTNNPVFYGLAKKMSEDAGPKADLAQTVASINKYSPPGVPVEEFKQKVDPLEKGSIVPIDRFFEGDGGVPAYCYERTLLTQLVLAGKGHQTMRVNLRNAPSGDTPGLNHMLLKVVDGPYVDTNDISIRDGQRNISASIVGQEEELRKKYGLYGEISITQTGDPNVFSPVK